MTVRMLKGNMKIIAPVCSLTICIQPQVGLQKIQSPSAARHFLDLVILHHPEINKNKPTRAMYQYHICSFTNYQLHDALQYAQVRPFRKKSLPCFMLSS